MAVVVRIPAPLRPLAEGRDEVRLDGSAATVGDLLEALWMLHRQLRDRVVTELGEVRPHVNIFAGTKSIRFTGGLATPLADGPEVAIIPAVSGGAVSKGRGSV
jgi:molybdopterin synthase sulfur carrier subunit